MKSTTGNQNVIQWAFTGGATGLGVACINFGLRMSFLMFPWGLKAMLLRAFPTFPLVCTEWFDGLTISHSGSDETVLSGSLPDQTALYEIISHLRDLGLELASIRSQRFWRSKATH